MRSTTFSAGYAARWPRVAGAVVVAVARPAERHPLSAAPHERRRMAQAAFSAATGSWMLAS
jgi:hypothetical protein